MTDTRPVLIVDDEPQIASALSRGLALHGFATVAEHDAEGALARLRGGGLRAAVIDVMLGPDSGLRLVARARELGVGLPILMLSALSEVEDRTDYADEFFKQRLAAAAPSSTLRSAPTLPLIIPSLVWLI